MPTSEGTSSRRSAAAATRLGSRLPETALVALREAFAVEVSERLPRLRSAARTLAPDLLGEAARDLHTLRSSAYVVGDDEVAALAVAAEAALAEGRDVAEFVGLVSRLDARLSGWLR